MKPENELNDTFTYSYSYLANHFSWILMIHLAQIESNESAGVQ
jgi:hypothetical protein